jgi:hypothetical protein
MRMGASLMALFGYRRIWQLLRREMLIISACTGITSNRKGKNVI